MDKFQSIEDKLRQLAPPAISEEGQLMLEETIDELAGESLKEEGLATVVQGTAISAVNNGRSGWLWKSAAAIALLAVPAVIIQFKSLKSNTVPASLAVTTPAGDVLNYSELVLLKSTNRIDASEDDGVIIPNDGSAPHRRYRYFVIDEEQVRDEETGTIIILRQPRREVVTIPVTKF